MVPAQEGVWISRGDLRTMKDGMGGFAKKPTTFGGSLKSSGDDFQMRRPGGAVKIQNSKDLSRWAPGDMNMWSAL